MSKERENYRAPRGIRDILPGEGVLWRYLEATGARLARLRGYREIRPALIEETRLFTRSVGEVTDIVQKEMFTLQKGDTQLALRPEGTAGIVRAYLQAGYAKTQPVQRLFNIGPMFRYERPQKGRERMFTQFDVEALGSLDPRLDAEIIHIATSFFEDLGLQGLEVRVNSMGEGQDRERYREAVRAFLAPKIAEHCELCRERFERNVLRVLDCKNPKCQELHDAPPSILEFLSPENQAHFDSVQAALGDLGREVVVDPGIVRGLDYYTRTVFEVHLPSLGARSALCGGGRYDHLIQELGGPDLGAVGCAVGFTPTLVALEESGVELGLVEESARVYVAAIGEGLSNEVFRTSEHLRGAGISAIYDVEGRATLKSQLKAAAKGGQRFCLLVGGDEKERGHVQLKDLESTEQEELTLEAAVRRIHQVLERISQKDALVE
jgi:histidyl-tRNA synthetase